MGLALSLSQPNLNNNRLHRNPQHQSPSLAPALCFTSPKSPFSGTPSNRCPCFPGLAALGVRHQESSSLPLFCLITAVRSWSQRGGRTGPGCPVMLSLFPLLLISASLEWRLFPNTPPLPGSPSTDAQAGRAS